MDAAIASTDPQAIHATPADGAKSTRWMVWTAAALAVLSIATFVVQVFWANLLFTPWYMPIGGTIAAVLALLAFASRRSLWRLAIGLLCLALAGLDWQFLLSATLLPAYAGSIKPGSALPPFHAALADGAPIDESFFKNGEPTAIVFFQGRWCPFCMTHLRDLEGHREEFKKVGARVVVVSIEDVSTAAETKRDYPSLTVVADERRELTDAINVLNRGFHPEGGDSAAPTIVLVDGQGQVTWVHRPARFIARPSALELARRLGGK